MNPHSIVKKENRQLAQGVFEMWKERGETLAALVRRFRFEEDIADSIPVTYAGRLDPMAEGVVILLAGEACHRKEEYMGREKTYRFEVLLGISTDTYDALGVIGEILVPVLSLPSKEAIQTAIEVLLQTPLPYPPFSSKPVDGVPLFMRAKEGSLPKQLPLQQGVPHSVSFIRKESITLDSLVESIVGDIKKVAGDFRQPEIIERWEMLRREHSDHEVSLLLFEARVPSGIYIRSIAHELGKLLKLPALAYRIVRMAVHE